jgi:prolipoprotein diacylglyceryltransferase
VILVWADRRFRMGHGRVFALYVALYTLGRSYIETLRIDPAREVLGLRLNVWTSVVLFVGAVVYIVVSARLRPGREELRAPEAAEAEAAATVPPVEGVEHQ